MGKAIDATRSLPHHEARFLQAMHLLIETGKVKTAEDLIKYSEQAKERTAANYIATLAAENLPVDLVFDALGVHLRMIAHKRNNALLTNAQDKKIGAILPLPLRVLNVFLPFPHVTLFLPDGHPLPPFLEQSHGALARGGRECRQEIGHQDIVVFEVYRDKNAFFINATAADILDSRMVKSDAHLVVHLRPHRDPEDVALTFPAERLHLL